MLHEGEETFVFPHNKHNHHFSPGITMKSEEEVRREEEKRKRTIRELENKNVLPTMDDKKNSKKHNGEGTEEMWTIFWKAFSMTFFAEWGDRSQVATIFLSNEGALSVLLGAFAGQVICNGIAIVGGSAIGKVVSIKTITILGGIIFIAFAVASGIHSLLM